ncbi:MAG: hypothetical protein L0I76_30495 [Pseudonocardia sp.]|nr:hypothetical protein [Pseudonocardia sp.]
MKIIGTLRGGPCGNGIDCDTIYDTDGDDVLVRGRTLTAEQRAAFGLTPPEHEDLLLVERRHVMGGDPS